MEVSRGRKDDEATTVKALNIRADEEMSNVSGQKKLVHRESVKHVVFQSCRSSSMSGHNSSPLAFLLLTLFLCLLCLIFLAV